MMGVKRLLAGATASAFLASAALIGLTAGPAHAAPKMTVTPNQGVKGGDKIQVKVTGMPASTAVAVGICKIGRAATGPGDCVASKTGGSALLATDASGTVSTTLTVVEGPAQNSTPPKYDCGPSDPCEVRASTIGGDVVEVGVKLNYAGGKAAAPKTEEKAPAAPAPADTGSDTDSGAAAADDDAALSTTGPRETAIIALVGFALFQLGLVFAVRSHRASPRRAAI
jgi:hypothetical protein